MATNPLTDFAATGWVDIDRDPSVWDTYITNEIKKVVGKREVDITISWTNRNDKKGYAVGTAAISDPTTKNRFSIPIIIQEFRIAPLDHMFAGRDVALKFNEENVKQILGTTNMSLGVLPQPVIGISSPTSDMETYPQEGKTIQWSVKSASDHSWPTAYLFDFMKSAESRSSNELTVLPFISGEISKVAYDRFTNTLENDTSTLQKYGGARYKVLEMIQSAEFVRPKSEYEAKNPAIGNPPAPIKTVAKTGPNKYVIMSSSPEAFEPSMGSISGNSLKVEISKLFPEESVIDQIFSIIDLRGSKGITISQPDPNAKVKIMTDEDMDINPETIVQTGFYKLYDSDSKVNVQAFVVHNMYNPDGSELKGNLCITQNGHYMFTTSDLTGVRTDPFELMTSGAGYGQEGVFLYILKDNEDRRNAVIAVGPLTIESVSTDGYRIVAESGRGEASLAYSDVSTKMKSGDKYLVNFSHVRSLGAKQEPRQFSDNDKRTKYLMPKEYNWVKFTGEVKLASYKDPVKEEIKQASVIDFEAGRYRISHPDLGKMAEKFLPEAEATFALAALGASLEAQQLALEKAAAHGKAYVTELKFVPRKNEPSRLETWIDSIHDRYNFVKSAAIFDNISTVDSVLGLNFMSRANIGKFVSVLPKLKEARADAIRLLYVARIGGTELDEESLIQTIDGLDEVIEGLGKMKLRLETLV